MGLFLRLPAIFLLSACASLSSAGSPVYSCLADAPNSPSDLVLWVYTEDPCSPEVAARRDRIVNIDVRVKEGDLTVIRDLHADMLSAHRAEIRADPLSPWKMLDKEYSSFENAFIKPGTGAKRRQFIADYSGNVASLESMGAYFNCSPSGAVFFANHKNKVDSDALVKLWVLPIKDDAQHQNGLFEYCSRVKMARQALQTLLSGSNKKERTAEIDEVELNTKEWKDYLQYGRLAFPWEFWRSSHLAQEYMLPAPPSSELILLHPSLVFEFGDTSPLTQGVLLDVVGFTKNIFWDSRAMNCGFGKGNFPSVWWGGVSVVLDARVSDWTPKNPIPVVGLGISFQSAVYIGDLEYGVTWRPNVRAPFWFIGFEPLGLLQKIVSAV